MGKLARVNSSALLATQMVNKDFKVEYDALEEEFAIAREIIKLREKAHLTQKQLAQKAGTSQPAISRLESGEYHNISLSFLRKISKVLGVIPEIHFRKS